jgi:hypothetical protein
LFLPLRNKRFDMSTKGNSRETTLLIIVAVVGIAGLAVLQFSRKSPANRSGDRALVQAENQNTADPQASAPIQKIPGELLRTSEYPEAGKPFKFLMSKHSQGAVYELDLGDGSPRKQFVNGAVQHTFKRPGSTCVTLYAKYEGDQVLLDTLCKIIANRKEEAIVVPAVDL